MISEKDVSVFNSGCDAFVNTVNCRGVMGAGIALEFKLRYPDMFEQYVKDCSDGAVRIGELKCYKSNGDFIINFPTKDHWREPSEIWYVEKGLDYFVNHYKEWGVKSVAIPPLGCSNGHLDFKIVRNIICSKLKDVDLDIVICTDNKNSQGKEKEMVDNLHSCNIDFVCDYLNIRPKQKQTIISNYHKITRFFELFALEGIGEKTYGDLHNLFYREYGKCVETEKKMVKTFNECDIFSLCGDSASKPQLKLMAACKPIERFTDISKADGVTELAYRKVFNAVRNNSDCVKAARTQIQTTL